MQLDASNMWANVLICVQSARKATTNWWTFKGRVLPNVWLLLVRSPTAYFVHRATSAMSAHRVTHSITMEHVAHLHPILVLQVWISVCNATLRDSASNASPAIDFIMEFVCVGCKIVWNVRVVLIVRFVPSRPLLPWMGILRDALCLLFPIFNAKLVLAKSVSSPISAVFAPRGIAYLQLTLAFRTTAHNWTTVSSAVQINWYAIFVNKVTCRSSLCLEAVSLSATQPTKTATK